MRARCGWRGSTTIPRSPPRGTSEGMCGARATGTTSSPSSSARCSADSIAWWRGPPERRPGGGRGPGGDRQPLERRPTAAPPRRLAQPRRDPSEPAPEPRPPPTRSPRAASLPPSAGVRPELRTIARGGSRRDQRQHQPGLSGLSERLRTVFVLREIVQLDYESIAAALRIPLGTVRSRLARSREALQQALRHDDRT